MLQNPRTPEEFFKRARKKSFFFLCCSYSGYYWDKHEVKTALSLALSCCFLLSSGLDSLHKNQFSVESRVQLALNLDCQGITKWIMQSFINLFLIKNLVQCMIQQKNQNILFTIYNNSSQFSPWPPYWFVVITINFTERRPLNWSIISLVVQRISQFGESTGGIIL